MVSPVVANLACVGLVAADMFTRAVRIRRLVTGLGGRLSFGDALRLNLLGDAAAELTPFRAGGEPSRVGALVQSRVRTEVAVLAVGVELVLSYGLLALLAVAASWTMLPAWWSSFGPTLHGAARIAPFAAAAVVPFTVAWAIRRRRRRASSSAAAAGGQDVRVAGLRSSVAALSRIGWRDVTAAFALGIPNTVARLGILWVLVSTLPGAPPTATTLVGSFVLLFGQALAPTPSGVGVVEMGMLGGAAGPLGPHAVSVLLYWRAYTAILPIVLAAVFALPRFGARPVLAALRLRRARMHSPESREEVSAAHLGSVFATARGKGAPMTVRILLLVAALGIASACAQSTAPTAPTPVQTAAASPGAGAPSQTIAIAGASEAAGTAEAFDPGAVSIRPGASVVFTNDDAVAHSLAADDGSWSSGNIDAEGTFSVTFPRTGTFGYHDTAHPEIRGVVIVQ